MTVPISITGRHMSVTDAMKDYATEKAKKLERYYQGQIHEIELVIDNDGDRRQVEMIIRARQRKFVAHVEHEDAYAAIDLLLDKMERQLTKQKEKLKLKKRSGESNRVGQELANAEAAAAAAEEEDEETFEDAVENGHV